MKQITNLLQRKLHEISKIKPKLEKSFKKNEEIEGYLVISNSHGRQQYYHVDSEKKKHYISTKNNKLISSLAQKSYDQMLLGTPQTRNSNKKSSQPSSISKYLHHI